MKYDFWRFTGVLILGFLIGYISGYLALSVIASLILYIYWQYKEFTKIRRQIAEMDTQHAMLTVLKMFEKM